MSIGLNTKSKLITTKEVAEILNISETGVRRLINGCKIRFYKVGRNIRFDIKDIEKYLEQISVEPVDFT
ncbi:MAG: helix-turn-helix domain-containing protein [Patescibacteria group bacterium]|nr:helix-turn-helix domain-containing protein [Patescibacteria group bacterium]